MRGNLETYIKCCYHKSKLFISFSSSIACFKTTVYMLVFFMRNVNTIYLCSFIISISIKNNIKSIEHVVSYLKLVVRVLKTILKKGQTKLCYHPPPRSTTTHHQPNMSTTTHQQPKYIHHYLPFPKKWTTTPQKPKYIHKPPFDIALTVSFFFEMQYYFP